MADEVSGEGGPAGTPDPGIPHDAGYRDEVRVTVAGLVGWVVALVLLATVFHHDLVRHHTTWWLWTCAIGIALGLYGLRFALRRRHR